ncbi:DUF488 domain-containing protein [Rhizobium azibense]|uniref:Uncharacterized protein YeaO (DUF488 family) n=1 Tax=Rhizobium azibense TaxID=1136135 RepID=A0A4R3RVA6_9HYPH|nr:DUF488 family protein [Rhizobium azibense]TCU40168.1 uncharacterized protein YeaO (DUF488 family) [Rhizobium azibense]
MAISIVQLGSPRSKDEGLRIGTVRRPPRGVAKEEFASRDYYDVWLPMLAPSQELVAMAKAAQTEAEWQAFSRAYRKEMNAPDTSRVLDTLAALSHTANFAVGCYCENESRCHRSLLRGLLAERGAQLGAQALA